MRLVSVDAIELETTGVRGDRRFYLADGEVQLGEPLETNFYGRPVIGRVVHGPWNEPLSELAGKPVRVARTEREGDGVDRGRRAGASLVSTGSLDALGVAAGATRAVDGRRFRMTIGVDGVEPHAEDGWIGSRVRVGGAVVAADAAPPTCRPR